MQHQSCLTYGRGGVCRIVLTLQKKSNPTLVGNPGRKRIHERAEREAYRAERNAWGAEHPVLHNIERNCGLICGSVGGFADEYGAYVLFAAGRLIAVRAQSVNGKTSGVPPHLTLCALPA